MKSAHYRSFVLRLWEDSDTHIWRFSLEDPHTGERVGMANLDALIEYLKEVMEHVHNDSTNHPSA
ncbi:hypothetical protein GPROT1_00274 [Gammaproteobacteria bacterium]|nr:hypothetical protein GPROT1_00274 [Gammaproteobacteria bacterium]